MTWASTVVPRGCGAAGLLGRDMAAIPGLTAFHHRTFDLLQRDVGRGRGARALHASTGAGRRRLGH